MAMLKHARHYGLRYIFVHDAYYEPMLTFAGWRQIANFNHGEITVWTTTGISPAHDIPSPLRPPRWQGIMWGTLPIGASLLTIVLFVRRVRKRRNNQQAVNGEIMREKSLVEEVKNAEHTAGTTVASAG